MNNIGYTMKNLNGWTCALYEKYGWMMLAKVRGHKEKVSAYKKSINHLDKAINNKMNITQNANRKTNLNVLCKKVMILKKAAKRL